MAYGRLIVCLYISLQNCDGKCTRIVRLTTVNVEREESGLQFAAFRLQKPLLRPVYSVLTHVSIYTVSHQHKVHMKTIEEMAQQIEFHAHKNWYPTVFFFF